MSALVHISVEIEKRRGKRCIEEGLNICICSWMGEREETTRVKRDVRGAREGGREGGRKRESARG